MNKRCFKGGFTLIELLVVVLIIGILAAIALPQYNKAVRKSRAVQGLATLDALVKAEEAYYLANGRYASEEQLDQLPLDVPSTTDWLIGIAHENTSRADAQFYVGDEEENIFFVYYINSKQKVCQFYKQVRLNLLKIRLYLHQV